MITMSGKMEHDGKALALPRSLAPFACRAEESRGRLHPEPPSPIRTAFQRDRDRIIHCSAFRRLTYKTQVFIYHEGDHYRTRLTHSLEVAQIARTLARVLQLDEDLAEAIALAHDLGHTPFGHAGEDALDAAMAAYGGFDHNAQNLRIVTGLERRYADFDGLNLTWETLEGLVKHNGPLADDESPEAGSPILPQTIRAYCSEHGLSLSSFASAEAQIAALADDIAYNNHDIDDGLRAGLITIEQVREVPLVGRLITAVEKQYGGLSRERLIFEVNRRLISAMIYDLLNETRQRLSDLNPRTADDIREAGVAAVAFSAGTLAELSVLREFLHSQVYRHRRIARIMADAQRVLRDLFDHYAACPDDLPGEWRAAALHCTETARARHICDFIAGMTDRFALRIHQRLFDDTPELR